MVGAAFKKPGRRQVARGQPVTDKQNHRERFRLRPRAEIEQPQPDENEETKQREQLVAKPHRDGGGCATLALEIRAWWFPARADFLDERIGKLAPEQKPGI